MTKIITGLLVLLLAPLANATIYRYAQPNTDLAGGGSFDFLFTEYDTSTSVMTWAVDNIRLGGELMDGFWLVTNNGPDNPAGEDGLAIMYADFTTSSLWAFAYSGELEPSSFSTEEYFGNFSAGLFSGALYENLGNVLGFSINMDSIYANLLSSQPFDENIGIWFRPTWGTVTDTDATGRLTSFSSSGFSWYDIAGGSTTVVPLPGALLLYGSALFGLSLVRRTRSK